MKSEKVFFVLEPMDDVTDVVFRQIVASTCPPDVFFTEFVNVDGVQRPGREALLPKIKKEKKYGTEYISYSKASAVNQKEIKKRELPPDQIAPSIKKPPRPIGGFGSPVRNSDHNAT